MEPLADPAGGAVRDLVVAAGRDQAQLAGVSNDLEVRGSLLLVRWRVMVCWGV
jgi:hypothetical protein